MMSRDYNDIFDGLSLSHMIYSNVGTTKKIWIGNQ